MIAWIAMSVEVYAITRTDLHVKVQNELEWTSVKTELRLILDVRSKIKPGNGGDFPFLHRSYSASPPKVLSSHSPTWL